MLDLPFLQLSNSPSRTSSASGKTDLQNDTASGDTSAFEADYAEAGENQKSATKDQAPADAAASRAQPSETETQKNSASGQTEVETIPDEDPAEETIDGVATDDLAELTSQKEKPSTVTAPDPKPEETPAQVDVEQALVSSGRGASAPDDAADTKTPKPEKSSAAETTAQNVVLVKAAQSTVQKPDAVPLPERSKEPASRGDEVAKPLHKSADQMTLPLTGAKTAEPLTSPRAGLPDSKFAREQADAASPPLPAKPKALTPPPTSSPSIVTVAADTKKTTVTSATDVLLTPLNDFEATGTIEPRTNGPTNAAGVSQILSRTETPAMIARQMAEALQRLPDRPVEISLNPKELGRVRMNISVAEIGITVNVIAERPETLDLMRRNIDQLSREFEAMGYDDIGFAFAEGEAQQQFSEQDGDGSDETYTLIDLDPMETSDAPARPVSQPSTGIDIRL